MNVLVTGGLGFIGTNLSMRLLQDGNKVFIIDDLSSGVKENLEVLKHFGEIIFIEDSIQNVDYDKVFEKIKIHQIYNLACDASPSFYQSDPVYTIETCTVGILKLLNYAKKHKSSFLQTSTSEVYGDPLEHPQKESYHGNVSCIGIRSCYDEGKRIAESIIMNYHRLYNLDTKIARIFNTYGKYMRIDDGRVISNFIVQSLSNQDITIYGDGFQTRSVCYIDDMVEYLVRLMESSYHFPVNVGNDEEYTINEIANIIKKETNTESNVIYFDLPEDDPLQRKPDLTLAKSILKYKPKYSVHSGIKKTIEYFKGNLIHG